MSFWKQVAQPEPPKDMVILMVTVGFLDPWCQVLLSGLVGLIFKYFILSNSADALSAPWLRYVFLIYVVSRW